MAKKITFEIDIDEKGAVKSLNKIEKGVDEVAKETTKAESNVKKFGKSFGSIAKSAGIVTLLLGAFELLKETLGKNQKVMDALSNVTTAIGIVFNDLFNLIADNVTPAIEYMTNLFSDIPGLFEKVKKAIYENLEVRFNALIKTFGLLGDAISKVFEGDFSGALESAGEAAETYVDVLTGVEGTVGKVVEGVTDLVDATIEYTKETYAQAEAITANTKSLELLEAQQTRIREQSDRDAERQRQIRDDETRSIDERIAANQELARILNEQEEREKQTVLDRIAALQAEQEQLGATQERRLEIFNLNTELAAIEAQQEGFRSEQLVNENALIREKLELKGFQTQAELEAFEEQEAIRQKEIQDSEAAIAQAKKEASEKIALENNIKNAKIAAAGQALNATSQFVEQGSKLGKAIAVAQAIQTTYQGANAIFAAAAANPKSVLFPAQPFIAAGAAVIAGLANVKSILAVKTPSVSSASANVSAASAAPPAATVTPPQFSTAADTGTSQLAADINQQNEPIQAYVVSESVTNQQQLDRQVEINTQF